MGRGDIEAARVVGRFVVLRCVGKVGNAGGAGYGVGDVRRMGFPPKGALARRAMGGMERGGGACARYCTPR